MLKVLPLAFFRMTLSRSGQLDMIPPDKGYPGDFLSWVLLATPSTDLSKATSFFPTRSWSMTRTISDWISRMSGSRRAMGFAYTVG
jgi:hypothetical protein